MLMLSHSKSDITLGKHHDICHDIFKSGISFQKKDYRSIMKSQVKPIPYNNWGQA